MPGSTDEQTAPQSPPLRVGVDVGGTFTDLVAFDPADGSLRVVKIPSTPPDFHRAVIEAVARVVVDEERPGEVVHGSTVATNALLQRAGEPVAFVTTEGFRDMLLIGRQDRPKLYALRVERPTPLTAEANWFTVRERIGATGNVVTPLDVSDVDRLVAEITVKGLRHVAVCLLFSFVNPAHERLIGDRCRAAGLTVSLSSEVLPEFREYERASTTVINASLRPRVEQYLAALEAGLVAERPIALSADQAGGAAQRSPGSDARSEIRGSAALRTRLGREADAAGASGISLSIMHSAGGTLSPTDAGISAARLVLSGPAGGVMGAAFVARAAGFEDVITYDMGGTSTDVATVVGGQPQWTTGHSVDGLPIGLPAFDIHTVGAGGGSVAYLDAGGALRVGPRSAGAVPGPACYGRGGTEPTVTDANVLLGRIVADRFAGGTVTIDAGRARRAIEPLARSIGKSPEETALGILRVAEDNMAHAVRAVTSRRGLDPRRFTLVSFGGAGGLHACAVADALEITRVLVPPYCGVLSALGMVVAPSVADASRTVVHLGDALDDARIAAEFGAVSMETIDRIPYEQTASVEAWADVRFKGQSHELKVRVERPLGDVIADAFRAAYVERFGHVPVGRTVEIVTLRVRRIGHAARLSLPPLTVPADVVDARAPVVIVDSLGDRVEVPALTRNDLAARGGCSGPLLIVDPEATAFVPAEWSAHADPFNAAVVLSRADR